MGRTEILCEGREHRYGELRRNFVAERHLDALRHLDGEWDGVNDGSLASRERANKAMTLYVIHLPLSMIATSRGTLPRPGQDEKHDRA